MITLSVSNEAPKEMTREGFEGLEFVEIGVVTSMELPHTQADDEDDTDE